MFEAVPNRWDYEFPTDYHRYPNFEVPYVNGHWYDPFNRNKLKGDYPIIGNQTFLEITFTSDTFADGRRLPTPSGLGSANAQAKRSSSDASGSSSSMQNLAFSFNLFHGDRRRSVPPDWRIQITPEVNVNYLAAQENGVVNFDVRKGTTRLDSHLGLQEGFAEVKLKDLSNQYDFVSLRVGVQILHQRFPRVHFLGPGAGRAPVRQSGLEPLSVQPGLFRDAGKRHQQRLEHVGYRNQQVMIANLYRQDFIKPGYTIQASFHYDKDDPSFQYDTDNFLVRPAPIGNGDPAFDSRLLLWPDRRRPLRQAEHHACFLSGAGHRQVQRDRRDAS